MKKANKRDTLNLLFSALLILGYIVCSYFFLTMASTAPKLAPYINALVFVMFGLVVFYATRVGEGVAVKRFSLWTLIILDIPALYIILAQFIPSLPLHTAIANLGGMMALDYSPLFILACVALGYGIPYTFLSGYELEELEEEIADEETEDDVNTEDSINEDETAPCEETAEEIAEEAAEVSDEAKEETEAEVSEEN